MPTLDKACGWEGKNLDIVTDGYGHSVVATTGLSMSGDYCLKLVDAWSFAHIPYTAASEKYFAFLYRPTGQVAYANGVIELHSGVDRILRVHRTFSENRIEVFRYEVSIGKGSKLLPDDTTYLIELYIKIHNTTGVATVWINGVQDFTFSGDTLYDVCSTFDLVCLGNPTGVYANPGGLAYYDNFMSATDGRIGPAKIWPKLISADGTYTDLTPSTGTDHYAVVDERPASSADYLESNTVNHKDSFSCSAISTDCAIVLGVAVKAVIDSDGSPTPTHAQLMTRSDSTDDFSADKDVSSSPEVIDEIFQLDPASNPWTPTTARDAQIGVKLTA